MLLKESGNTEEKQHSVTVKILFQTVWILQFSLTDGLQGALFYEDFYCLQKEKPTSILIP